MKNAILTIVLSGMKLMNERSEYLFTFFTNTF